MWSGLMSEPERYDAKGSAAPPFGIVAVAFGYPTGATKFGIAAGVAAKPGGSHIRVFHRRRGVRHRRRGVRHRRRCCRRPARDRELSTTCHRVEQTPEGTELRIRSRNRAPTTNSTRHAGQSRGRRQPHRPTRGHGRIMQAEASGRPRRSRPSCRSRRTVGIPPSHHPLAIRRFDDDEAEVIQSTSSIIRHLH